jgi:hypothetical protein
VVFKPQFSEIKNNMVSSLIIKHTKNKQYYYGQKYNCKEKETIVSIINHYTTWGSFLHIHDFNVQLPKITICTKQR